MCARSVVVCCLTALAATFAGPTMVQAQDDATLETPEQHDARMAWWREARFGMFIHWGLYAMPARHEWVKMREMITEEHYDLYQRYFPFLILL